MEQGNDYLVGVKGNQPKLLLAIQQVAQQQTPVAQQVERERTRNRVVERTVSIYNDISAIDSNWVGAQSLIVVRRQGTRQGVSFDKLSYYLSSLALPAVEFGLGIRGHRLIENGLHWVKDVVFGEDGAPFSAYNAATNWSTIRSFDLNLLRRCGYHAISRSLRLFRHDLDALFPLLTMN